jgi:hypothetical protein
MEELLKAYADACNLQNIALDNKNKEEAKRQALIKTIIRQKIKELKESER